LNLDFREVNGNIVEKNQSTVEWSILESLENWEVNGTEVKHEGREAGLVSGIAFVDKCGNEVNFSGEVLCSAQIVEEFVEVHLESVLYISAVNMVLDGFSIVDAKSGEEVEQEVVGIFGNVHWDIVAIVEFLELSDSRDLETEEDLPDVGISLADLIELTSE